MARPSKATPQHDDDESLADEYDGPSKSQKKRDMNALQDLGVALIDLGKEALVKLDLPDELLKALLDAKKITANGAIKRQRQYIGRLMREVDPAPIQAYMDTLKGDNHRHTAWLHQLERTREELLASDEAFTKLLDEHPDIDIPELRQLIRNTRSERTSTKPPKHYRALFQYLKDLYPEPSFASVDEENAFAEEEGDEEHDDE